LLIAQIDFPPPPFLGYHGYLPSTAYTTELISESTHFNPEDGSILLNVSFRQYDYKVSTQKTTI
jgi:hypothetical protein